MGYPEHDKLKAVSAMSQACGEFLDWLTGDRGYTLGEYHVHGEHCVEGGRKVCGCHDDVLYPTSHGTQRLLAQFFEIDEDTLDAEKRAMLAELTAVVQAQDGGR